MRRRRLKRVRCSMVNLAETLKGSRILRIESPIPADAELVEVLCVPDEVEFTAVFTHKSFPLVYEGPEEIVTIMDYR